MPVDAYQILDQIPVFWLNHLNENQEFEVHVCFASFIAQDTGDISINEGDIIVATNKVNEHWMQGQVCFDSKINQWQDLKVSQQVGTFPLNHCWRLDTERLRALCHDKLKEHEQPSPQTVEQQPNQPIPSSQPFIFKTAHSSSLSSRSSSLLSTDYQQSKQQSQLPARPPLPQRHTLQPNTVAPTQKPSLLTSRQQDKLKGWLHTVKKKTARLSTRITASLGLISLTRDEEFERHYESFKHIEKTIRAFLKNLANFVEHFESFLTALQSTSENLADFYRDKSHQRELEELKKKNKALACEHFHAFRRTVERHIIAVLNQLLQKFTGPHQLISKRSAKLLDYDNKTKELESCRDIEKKEALRDQYVIAKDLYDRINRQLIEELPLFNQFTINIFRECILVLLESRRNLILSYTKQTASLLDTPLMMSYTASDVASSILMSCDIAARKGPSVRGSADKNELVDKDRKDSGQTSGHDTRHSSANDDNPSRSSQSVVSQLSSEFDHLVIGPREISSTPLSQVSGDQAIQNNVKFDEPDCAGLNTSVGQDTDANSQQEATDDALNSDVNIVLDKKDPPKENRKKRKFQIYIASWPFVATGPNQLTITCMQPLKLIKGCDECGNSDWSLVQDKKGQLGYVPSSYIQKKE